MRIHPYPLLNPSLRIHPYPSLNPSLNARKSPYVDRSPIRPSLSAPIYTSNACALDFSSSCQVKSRRDEWITNMHNDVPLRLNSATPMSLRPTTQSTSYIHHIPSPSSLIMHRRQGSTSQSMLTSHAESSKLSKPTPAPPTSQRWRVTRQSICKTLPIAILLSFIFKKPDLCLWFCSPPPLTVEAIEALESIEGVTVTIKKVPVPQPPVPVVTLPSE